MSHQINQEIEEEQPRPQQEAAVVAALPNADVADSSSSNADRSADLATWLERHSQQIILLNDITCAQLAKLLLQKSEEELKDGSTLDGLRNYLKGFLDGRAEIREGEMTKKEVYSELVNLLMPRELPMGKERTVTTISYKITETELYYKGDLSSFGEYVVHVFNEYYGAIQKYGKRRKNREEFLYHAPYFVFIQSSGMGKTKILYHFAIANPCTKRRRREQLQQPKQGEDEKRPSGTVSEGQVMAILILCRNKMHGEVGEEEKKLFDCFLDCGTIADDIEGRKADYIIAFDIIDNLLEKILQDMIGKEEGPNSNTNNPSKIVLLFDESHLLLRTVKVADKTTGKTTDHPGLLFRFIRLFLAKKRGDMKQLSGVFTGTNGDLRNFRGPDVLPTDPNVFDSRDIHVSREFYERGKRRFDEFFSMTTIGCLRNICQFSESDSEYQKSIPYGRPLFATMQQDDKTLLPNLIERVAKRMLLIARNPELNWRDCTASCMSILGTRVQMGQASIDISSSLVARGYANLVGVGDTSATICFPTDPVCARLAMCLMDEEWVLTKAVSGMSKQFWVEKAKMLFSERLCAPEKGDFGEVMVALYFLLCADEERKTIDRNYHTFSVSLDAWLHRLVEGGKKEKEFEELKEGPTFGAIQVCRNYLRAYDTSWRELGNTKFLETIYKSGKGFYVFEGCKTIDLVFPLKIGDTEYAPMVVSVKSRSYFSPKDSGTELAKMEQKAKNAKWKCCLCLLVVFGSAKDEGKSSDMSEVASDLMKPSILTRILYIPENDQYGMSRMFKEITGVKQYSEVLTAQDFLTAHADSMATKKNKRESFVESCVRKQVDENGKAKKLALRIATTMSKSTRKRPNDTTLQRRSKRLKLLHWEQDSESSAVTH